MNSNDAIVTTKRLHVSGLTPAITKSDLSQRLSSFGTVVSLDGFDKVDGVGRPRPFGYVTFKASDGQLARCMNVLSGTTWKGTKLRIGEAKPDFRERISRENEQAAIEQSGKRRRLGRRVQGVLAADMSLVTPTNVHLRSGWRVTPLGRLIRPMRMRPLKPLPPLSAHLTRRKDSSTSPMKPKRRFKQALTRARRRTIDPTKWGSQHFKGAFLESVVVAKDMDTYTTSHAEKKIEEESSDDSTGESDNSDTLGTDAVDPPAAEEYSTSVLDQYNNDLAREKIQSLTLLESMFANLGENQDWEGRETVDSDVEMGELAFPGVSGVDPVMESTTEVQHEPTATNKLKDLFAPQEAQAFSLLDHLNLDLESEDEAVIPVVPKTQGPIDSSSFSYQHPPSTMSPSQVTFDPEQPLFFPISPDARSTGKWKAKDITGIMKDRGFDWREGFYRTESSEEITRRWEETKGELTRDWKRRHREAARSQRRRGDN